MWSLRRVGGKFVGAGRAGGKCFRSFTWNLFTAKRIINAVACIVFSVKNGFLYFQGLSFRYIGSFFILYFLPFFASDCFTWERGGSCAFVCFCGAVVSAWAFVVREKRRDRKKGGYGDVPCFLLFLLLPSFFSIYSFLFCFFFYFQLVSFFFSVTIVVIVALCVAWWHSAVFVCFLSRSKRWETRPPGLRIVQFFIAHVSTVLSFFPASFLTYIFLFPFGSCVYLWAQTPPTHFL